MSLDQILSALRDGVTKRAVQHTASLSETPPSLSTPSFSIESACLEQSVVEKVNNLYDLSMIAKTIHNTSKVDYNVAQEVFTMLPDTSIADRAKVTAAPSIINKEILENILKTQTGEYTLISYQLKTEIDKTIKDITENLYHMTEVKSYLESFLTQVQPDTDRLTGAAPIVICEGKTYNLFTRPVYNIYMEVNDRVLDYAKYSDTLNIQYYNILQDDTFKKYVLEIVPKGSIESMSLLDFVGSVRGTLERIDLKMGEFDSRLEKYESLKGAVEKEVTQGVVSLVNSTELIYLDLLFFKVLHDMVHTPDNVFDKVVTLLKFLD